MELEAPVTFEVEGDRVVGVLHRAESPTAVTVVILVGGPQYRIGSHRQFVRLARSIRSAGFDVLRFDFRGMGDSDGEWPTFERVDADIRCAIDFVASRRSTPSSFVLLGLCDGASAALMYAPSDARVRGLILLNPWARSESGHAKTQLRRYYLKRLIQRDFWLSVLTGKVQVTNSAREVAHAARAARTGRAQATFLSRMEDALVGHPAPIALLLSEQDLTADEFVAWLNADRRRKRAASAANVSRCVIEGANHTFSAVESHAQLVAAVVRACKHIAASLS